MPDPSPIERLIVTVFHQSRAAGKKKPNPGVDKIVEAWRERVENSIAACPELPDKARTD